MPLPASGPSQSPLLEDDHLPRVHPPPCLEPVCINAARYPLPAHVIPVSVNVVPAGSEHPVDEGPHRSPGCVIDRDPGGHRRRQLESNLSGRMEGVRMVLLEPQQARLSERRRHDRIFDPDQGTGASSNGVDGSPPLWWAAPQGKAATLPLKARFRAGSGQRFFRPCNHEVRVDPALAAITRATASHCIGERTSCRKARPTRAATAGSRLIRMPKVRAGSAFSAIISSV